MDVVLGYPRADGRFGVRNHVIVISLVQCANTTANKIASACEAPAITMDWGCGEFNEDAQRTSLGLLRAGVSPNVYGVLLVSLGCEWTDADWLRAQMEQKGTRVEFVCIQKMGGMEATIEKGIAAMQMMQKEAALQVRQPFPMSGLVIGVTCGGSDWTSSVSGNNCEGAAVDLFAQKGCSFLDWGVRGLPGAEPVAVNLAASYEVGEQILRLSEQFRRELYLFTGQSIAEVNPTPGNKAGGITTMAEKAYSNYKMKGTTPIQGILQVGEDIPGDRPGMWILDQRMGGNDVFACTAIAMGGAHVILFCTGRGSPLGNAVCPVIKLTGNPHTAGYLSEMIDYNSAGVLEGTISLEQAGKQLYELTLEVIDGKHTKSEQYGDYSYATPPVWHWRTKE